MRYNRTMRTNTTHRTGLVSVLCFIAITLIATYAVQFHLVGDTGRFDTDVTQHTPLGWLFLIMWIPGITGILTTRFIEGVPWRDLRSNLALRMGSVGPYLLTFALAPLAFAIMYGASWLLGLAGLESDPAALARTIGTDEPLSVDGVLTYYLPFTIAIGPLIHFPFALGEEIGWRGFLLPRLLPLGKPAAYLISGIVWGLWHAPIIWVGFNYPGHPMAGIALMCVLTSAFGWFLAEMTLHYRSTLLAAFIHGAINGQGFGVWTWIFPNVDPVLGGGTGLTAITFWLLTAISTTLILSRFPKKTDQSA